MSGIRTNMSAIVVFVALAMSVEVNLIGRLTGTEILFLALLPFCLRRLERSTDLTVSFYALCGFWFLGTVASDLYRDTQMTDLLKGWASLIFFVLNFTAVRALVGTDLARIRLLTFFLYVASAIRVATGVPGDVTPTPIIGDAWKYGYGQLATAAVALFSAYCLRRSAIRPIGFVLPYLCAVVNFALNARNLGGAAALSALAAHATTWRRRPLSAGAIATLAVVLFGASAALISGYQYAAANGYLSKSAYEKYQMQSEGSLNFLVSGRTEWLASPQAVMDSPLIGHGSWPRDKKYVDLMESRMLSSGLATQAGLVKDEFIPTHSYLMQAWVESGILGACFWCWALFVTCRGLYCAVKRPTVFNAYYMFIGITLLWDTFFSPFKAEARVVVAARLYLMLLLSTNDKSDTSPVETSASRNSNSRSTFPNLMQ